MFRRKVDPKTAARSIVAFPAVFRPNETGAWDVYFPNFPDLTAAGVNRELAAADAAAALTDRLCILLRRGSPIPRPSDLHELPADDDDPAGTCTALIDPDREDIHRRLRLKKEILRTGPDGKYRP